MDIWKISLLKGCWRLPVDPELCYCRKSVGERLTIRQNHLVCGFGWGYWLTDRKAGVVYLTCDLLKVWLLNSHTRSFNLSSPIASSSEVASGFFFLCIIPQGIDAWNIVLGRILRSYPCGLEEHARLISDVCREFWMEEWQCTPCLALPEGKSDDVFQILSQLCLRWTRAISERVAAFISLIMGWNWSLLIQKGFVHLATVARLLSTFPEVQGRHSSCVTLISMGVSTVSSLSRQCGSGHHFY